MKVEVLTHLHDIVQAARAILVWGIIHDDLTNLLEDVNALIADAQD